MKKLLLLIPIVLLGLVFYIVRADTQGANSPGTMADDATVGTVAWVNPDNAKVSDNVYATNTAPSDFPRTHYLKATNFGFSIPSGATINGILVEIEAKVSSGSGNFDIVRLVKGGAIEATSKASAGNSITTSDSYASVPTSGGPTDLWGGTWTDTDINNSGFGVAITTPLGVTGFVLSVDHIRITVYYTVNGVAQVQVRSGSIIQKSGSLIVK